MNCMNNDILAYTMVEVREVVQIAEFYLLTGILRYYFTCEIELDVCWMQLR